MVAQGFGRVPMIPPTFQGEVDEEVGEFVSNYQACAAGNGWGDALALTNLSYYLRGRARAVYDAAVANGTFFIQSVVGATREAIRARVKTEPSELQAEMDRLEAEDQIAAPALDHARAAMLADPGNVTSDIITEFGNQMAAQATRGNRMMEIRSELRAAGAGGQDGGSDAGEKQQEPSTLHEVLEWLRGEFTYEQTRDARVGAFLRKKQKQGESARSHAHALLLLHRKAGLNYERRQLCATFINSLQDDLKRLLKSELSTRGKEVRENWEAIRELADELEKKYFHLVNPARQRVARVAAIEDGDHLDAGEPELAAIGAGPPRGAPGRAAAAPAGRTFQGRSVVCYGCGKAGHYRRECPTASDRRPGPGLRCYECGQVGHYARYCAERRPVSGRRHPATGNRGPARGRTAQGGGNGAQVAQAVAALTAYVGHQRPLNA
jgi:hypothetical protein